MDWIEVKVHTTTAGADLVSEQLMQEGATAPWWRIGQMCRTRISPRATGR